MTLSAGLAEQAYGAGDWIVPNKLEPNTIRDNNLLRRIGQS